MHKANQHLLASCLLGAPGSLHPPTVGRSSHHAACISSPLKAASVLVSVLGATKHTLLQMLPREMGLGARKRATAVSTVAAALGVFTGVHGFFQVWYTGASTAVFHGSRVCSLSSGGTWADSVVTCGLSCPGACGILVP